MYIYIYICGLGFRVWDNGKENGSYYVVEGLGFYDLGEGCLVWGLACFACFVLSLFQNAGTLQSPSTHK